MKFTSATAPRGTRNTARATVPSQPGYLAAQAAKRTVVVPQAGVSDATQTTAARLTTAGTVTDQDTGAQIPVIPVHAGADLGAGGPAGRQGWAQEVGRTNPFPRRGRFAKGRARRGAGLPVRANYLERGRSSDGRARRSQ